jgi:hypothetical protein
VIISLCFDSCPYFESTTKTAAVLTDKGHPNQAKMRRQKATGLGQKFSKRNTRTRATDNNKNNDWVVCKVNYYDKNGPQVTGYSVLLAKSGCMELARMQQTCVITVLNSN